MAISGSKVECEASCWRLLLRIRPGIKKRAHDVRMTHLRSPVERAHSHCVDRPDIGLLVQ